MFDRFKGKERRVVCGVQFDSNGIELAKSAALLAERTEMTLRLTHVIEPWSPAYSGAMYPGEYVSAKIAHLALENREQQAKGKLKELAQTAGIGSSAENSIVLGGPSEALRAEALSTRASLLFCGFKPVSHRFVPKGLSTAMGLMADSSIPVMAIPEGKVFDFSKTKLTIMVADDFTDSSGQAVSTACELALNLKNTCLIHFHVNEKSKKELSAWADIVLEAMVAQDLRYDAAFSRDDIVEKTERHIKERMLQNIGFLADILNSTSGGSYNQMVAFGDVLDEFTRAVENIKPDIIVFGRHQLIHKRPFSMGKVPFHAMLNLNTPLVVAPNIQNLA